nr:MAG TPA: hypothetical protein [Caudoviricetes sp.]DAY72522.1 MAG TPA: hypothetical protein [Caudoviricetes sp.]
MSVRFRCLVEFYGGLCDNHIANKSWTERKHTIILG